MAKSIKQNKDKKKSRYIKKSKGNRKRVKRTNKNIKRVSLKKMHRGRKLRKQKTQHLHHNGDSMIYSGIMKGGMISSPASGPVGYPWDGGNIGSWPGAQASNGLDTNGMTMSNHLPLSKDGIAVGGINVARSSSDDQLLKGGRKMKRRRGKGQKGGFFQEIVNLGRGIQHNVNGGYFNLVGKGQPISQNPYPTQEQPIDGDYKYIGQPSVDVRKIYIDANETVSKI